MIVINARFLTQQITGVQRYAIEICEHLPKYIKEQEVILIAPKGDLLNEKKINNHRIVKFGKLKDLKEVPNKTNANIKNALFVGSTAELQKMLNKKTVETNSERKSENEQFEGKDITPKS